MKPKVIISRCLTNCNCRWDGEVIHFPAIRQINNYFDLITVCPEVDIGLGVPRKPIGLFSREGHIEVEELDSHVVMTEKVKAYSDHFLEQFPRVHGFISKSKSPSCGIKNVKILTLNQYILSTTGTGLFARKLLNSLPCIATIDETGLLVPEIREQFFTKLFAFFNLSKANTNISDLIKFHSQNKYLFMAYNPQKQKEAGGIIGTNQHNDFNQLFCNYSLKVAEILKDAPSVSSNINVLQHLFGYFSKKHLTTHDKQSFLNSLTMYNANKIPISEIKAIIRKWAFKYSQNFLKEQSYLQPFPAELLSCV